MLYKSTPAFTFSVQFMNAVKREVKKLKAILTDEQKARLDAETFNGKRIDECFYGQINIGNSTDAFGLKNKASIYAGAWNSSELTKLNKDDSFGRWDITPLEVYAEYFDRGAKHLIPYIKGESRYMNFPKN